MPTERPIPFSAPMVRAVLAGTKTQTRRALHPDLFISSGGAVVRMKAAAVAGVTGITEAHCPYWREPGDRLWVREAWRTSPMFDDKPPRELPEFAPLRYEADEALRGAWAGYGYALHAKYRPPMFMPRWASRILLEVTEVRVERLQAISEADAIAEGVNLQPRLAGYSKDAGCTWAPQDPREAYCNLWDQINGPGAWGANPWVWVVSFRVVTP